MRITLTNEAHGTSVDLTVNPDGTISAHQLAEAQPRWCPIEGCTQCEDFLGGAEEKTFGEYRLRRLSTGGLRVLTLDSAIRR
ncbi:MAG: hypothetical protein M0017_05625 [Desulfobacteraceae bacterium]|nr:hypothetical protein [Desulfobacteraceae bacterium]